MIDFKKLLIWEKSHSFTLEIYNITKNFPKNEMFGITQQLRRCAYSIPANIAEGSSRRTNRELAQFLQISMGSAAEAKYFLILSKDLNYISETQFMDFMLKINEVQKMITSFIKKTRDKLLELTNI